MDREVGAPSAAKQEAVCLVVRGKTTAHITPEELAARNAPQTAKKIRGIFSLKGGRNR
jgi:hypothetical protein